MKRNLAFPCGRRGSQFTLQVKSERLSRSIYYIVDPFLRGKMALKEPGEGWARGFEAGTKMSASAPRVVPT